jgi:hypothetical protein
MSFTKVFALALTGVCLTAFTADAAFLRPRLRSQVAQATKKESQKQSNEQLHEALHVLQVVKKTLEGADHDYGGHRVKAIKDIGQAEHQLRLALHHGHTGKKPGSGAGKGGKGTGGGKGEPEPQAVSDAQLAKSIPVLHGAIQVLKNANHDYGGHREKAVVDLEKAIVQLQTALKYSKEHDQNKK